MKQRFSTAWIASTQPRKQRKYLANVPLHLKKKLLVSTLSKELRKRHGIRNIEVRKGDEVEVMRGQLDGKKGKVSEVNTRKMKVAIEGIQKSKKDGTKINVWFNPSKIKIIVLNTEDKKRLEKPVKQIAKVKVQNIAKPLVKNQSKGKGKLNEQVKGKLLQNHNAPNKK